MTAEYYKLLTEISALCLRSNLTRRQMMVHSVALICNYSNASNVSIFILADGTSPIVVATLKPEAVSSEEVIEFETSPWLVTEVPEGDQVRGYFSLTDLGGSKLGVMRVESNQRSFFTPDCLEALVALTPLLSYLLQTESRTRAAAPSADLLARLSHDLRGPLNAIIGYSRILAQLESAASDNEPLDSRQVSIRPTLKSAVSLLGSIENILDYAWLQIGAYSLAFRSIEPQELLDAALAFAADLIGNKPVRVTGSQSPGTSALVGDLRALKQVLNNLIGNAIRFTERGEINLNLQMTPTGVQFNLQDPGRGVLAEQTAQMFSPFNQLDERGLGLGLYVSKQLLLRHGARLTVNGQPGQGAQFNFTLLSANRNQQANRRPLVWILSDASESDWWSDLGSFNLDFVITNRDSLSSNATVLQPDFILLDLAALASRGQVLIDLAMLEYPAPIAVVDLGVIPPANYHELGATLVGESPLTLIETLLSQPSMTL